MMKRSGIDVSKWQGKIDWAKVKAAGVQFALLRAGYGDALSCPDQYDPTFEYNYTECSRVGIPVGVYWYSYATTPEMARQEARACIAALKGKRFEYPIYYDVEEMRIFNTGRTNEIIKAFCYELEKAGCWVGIYIYRAAVQQYLDDYTRTRYALAVAEYGPKLNYDGQCGIWQNSGTWKVDGISTDVDLSAGTVTANGTATAKTEFRIPFNHIMTIYGNVVYTKKPIKSGKYYFCGSPSGGTSTSYWCFVYDNTTGSGAKKWNGTSGVSRDYGDVHKNEVLIDDTHSQRFTILIANGYTASNVVFRPMIWSGDIDDDTFEPYQIPTDERVYSLDIAVANVSQYVPDPDEGIYWITIIDHYSTTWNTQFDIYISTPNSDGGYFFGASESYPIPEHEVKLPRFHSYKGKAISFGIIAGPSDPVMAISSYPGIFSSSHTTSRWDKVFDADTFLNFCDVKDGSATNYMHIHLCDDGGIRNQAEYEAYIGS